MAAFCWAHLLLAAFVSGVSLRVPLQWSWHVEVGVQVTLACTRGFNRWTMVF